MFGTITDLTLASPMARKLFPRISAQNFRDDVSFLATARALLQPRLPEGESFDVIPVPAAPNGECTRIRGDLIRLEDFDDSTRALVVYNVTPSDQSREALEGLLRSLDASFQEADGWVSLPDVETFLSQKNVSARIFLHPEKRFAEVFVLSLTVPKWHLLQSLLPRLLPWYFQDHPLSKQELDLLLSLTRTNGEAYQIAIEAFAAQYDFRSLKIREGLQGFETRMERAQIQDLYDRIQDIDRRLEDLRASFARYCRDREELALRYFALNAKIERAKDAQSGEDSELTEYFLCNKSLHFISSEESKIKFIVTGYLDYFDPDVFDSTIANAESFFFYDYNTNSGYGNPEMTKDRIERLLRAIFQEGTIKVRTCAAFLVDFGSYRCSACRNFIYPVEFSGYMPNPHLDRYACLGNNEMEILEALKDKNYIQALEYCVAANRNLNLTDTAVGTVFMEYLLNPEAGMFLELPDGTCVTPIDAILFLEEGEIPHE